MGPSQETPLGWAAASPCSAHRWELRAPEGVGAGVVTKNGGPQQLSVQLGTCLHLQQRGRTLLSRVQVLEACDSYGCSSGQSHHRKEPGSKPGGSPLSPPTADSPLLPMLSQHPSRGTFCNVLYFKTNVLGILAKKLNSFPAKTIENKMNAIST